MGIRQTNETRGRDMAKQRGGTRLDLTPAAQGSAAPTEDAAGRMDGPRLEGCLLALPSVQDCFVMERADAEGVRHLVAYVVSNGAITPEAWDAQLAAEAPELRRPTSYVAVTN